MFVLLLYSHLYFRVQRSQAFIPPESDCYIILNLQFRTYKIISQYKFGTSDWYSVDHLVSLPSNFQILLAAKYKFYSLVIWTTVWEEGIADTTITRLFPPLMNLLT